MSVYGGRVIRNGELGSWPKICIHVLSLFVSSGAARVLHTCFLGICDNFARIFHVDLIGVSELFTLHC